MKEFVEKLISRLKERENHYRCEVEKVKRFSKIRICRELQMRAYETSIKIVNELTEEYNNDVCEWTEYDYKTIRSPHERDWSIPSMKDFKYCPYCGKKIKVVK